MQTKLRIAGGLSLPGLMLIHLFPAALAQSTPANVKNVQPVFTASAASPVTAASASERTDSSSQDFVGATRFQPPRPAATGPSFFSTLGIGAKVSPLGVGIEAATPLWSNINLRVGGNFFNYSGTFSQSGFQYQANLHFRSIQAGFDWFPFHNGFRITPGALLYMDNRVTAKPTVRGGQTFTVNDTDYISSVADPIRGKANVEFGSAAPTLTVGWGNLVPRAEGHRISFPVEVGFAYVGDPSVGFFLSGSACDANGQGCGVIDNDPTFQSNVQAEQKKIKDDVSPLRFYPIVSAGVGYRF
jgi:hypothetical protein